MCSAAGYLWKFRPEGAAARAGDDDVHGGAARGFLLPPRHSARAQRVGGTAVLHSLVLGLPLLPGVELVQWLRLNRVSVYICESRIDFICSALTSTWKSEDV